MFDLGAFWVAAKYEIPVLVVMYNNRGYYNEWDHQKHVATPEAPQTDAPILAWTSAGQHPILRGL